MLQTCLVPMEHLYEPNYESGHYERWVIGIANGEPFCVAGLWRSWEEEEGSFTFSFTQLTINAEQTPLMKRFHRHGDDKHSLVIIPSDDYRAWLRIENTDLAKAMLALYPAELMRAWPAPKLKEPPKLKKAVAKKVAPKSEDGHPKSGSLFYSVEMFK